MVVACFLNIAPPQAFAWDDGEKPRKVRGKVAGALMDIRTEYLPDTYPPRFDDRSIEHWDRWFESRLLRVHLYPFSSLYIIFIDAEARGKSLCPPSGIEPLLFYSSFCHKNCNALVLHLRVYGLLLSIAFALFPSRYGNRFRLFNQSPCGKMTTASKAFSRILILQQIAWIQLRG